MHSAEELHDNPTIEHLENEERLSEGENRARSIARDFELFDRDISPNDLRYMYIIEHLRREVDGDTNLLETQTIRVKKIFAEDLGAFGESLPADVWEILTVIELFDQETARHCVDTYLIAKNKVEKRLFNGMVLAESFKEESVDLDTFYTSCLLHDVGKVEVPHEVVTNTASDPECATHLFAHKDDILLPALRDYFNNPSFVLPETLDTPEALNKYLNEELHERPQKFTPINLLLCNLRLEKLNEVSRQLNHVGCTLDDSLLTIMRTHDKYSRDILKALGHSVEATLAGAHHHKNEDNKVEERKYRITIGTLRVSVDLADIIHLADVENAISNSRHYKSEKTPLEALKVLAVHAKNGAIDSYIAYLWIADVLNDPTTATLYNLEHENNRKNYEFIASYLDTQMEQHLGYPAWRLEHSGNDLGGTVAE